MLNLVTELEDATTGGFSLAKARLFVALPVEETVRERLASWAESVGDRGLKWVEPGNYHLTLKFLGDTDEGLVERIRELLGGVCRAQRPFEVGFSGIGGFPSASRARVLWAGVSAGAGELNELASRVDGALAEAGFEREKKPFSPHLTLARARGKDTVDVTGFVAAGDFGSFRAEGIRLYRSRLTPSGPVYTVLADLPFCKE